MRRIGLVLAALALAGCSNPRVDLARAAPQLLQNRAKADLLSCAGVPKQSVTVGDEDRLTYLQEETIVSTERDCDDDPPLWARMAGMPRCRTIARESVIQCRADVTLRGGRVVDVAYGEGRNGEMCYRLFANCLPPVKTTGP